MPVRVKKMRQNKNIPLLSQDFYPKTGGRFSQILLSNMPQRNRCALTIGRRRPEQNRPSGRDSFAQPRENARMRRAFLDRTMAAFQDRLGCGSRGGGQ
jgi:hypothetical protein